MTIKLIFIYQAIEKEKKKENAYFASINETTVTKTFLRTGSCEVTTSLGFQVEQLR